MTVQHQSYLEVKEEVGDEFARRCLLHNLKCCKNNVRATTRIMSCSSHTVYRAMRKEVDGELKDTSHRPKSRHPRHLEDEKEQMIIEYRQKTKLGKRRLRYFIFQKMRIDIPDVYHRQGNKAIPPTKEEKEKGEKVPCLTFLRYGTSFPVPGASG